MILLGVAVVGPILYRLVLATTFYPLTNWHNINAFENLTYYYFFSRIPSFGCGLISSLWLYKRGILFGKRRHSEADEYDGAAEIASPLCPPLIRRIGHVLAILLISFALIASQHFPPVLQMIEPMAAIPYPQVILTLAMVLRRLCFGMGSAWLIAQCVAGNAFVLQWFLSMRVWYPIASISYTAYCVHTTVLIILHEVVWIQPWEWWNLQNGSFFLQYAVNVVIVIAVSLPVHIFIERPFMKAVR
jgi:peptidoglycan/LPS O-acetylase OafA/YrhL